MSVLAAYLEAVTQRNDELFTDDDNVSFSCHISPWLSVPGQLDILADSV